MPRRCVQQDEAMKFLFQQGPMVSASRGKAKASKPRNTGIATVQMEVSNNFFSRTSRKRPGRRFFYQSNNKALDRLFIKGDDINFIKSR